MVFIFKHALFRLIECKEFFSELALPNSYLETGNDYVCRELASSMCLDLQVCAVQGPGLLVAEDSYA